MSFPKTKEDILAGLTIAIDGPSGSGKTTTAREVAERLGLGHLDTGAMYRAIALKALEAKLDLHDPTSVARVAETTQISFVGGPGSAQRVLADGADVTEAIRSAEVTEGSSVVSSHSAVRRAMVRRQRFLADAGGVVLEGRDIGSVVLPGADVKIYLDASIEVRAARRFKELQERHVATDVETVLRSIAERDDRDRTREVSPLTIPVGAYVLDTSELSIDEQVTEVQRVAGYTAEKIFGLIKNGGRHPHFKKRLLYAIGHLVVTAIVKTVWGARVIKKDPTPYVESFIYASNHRSNVDPPLVGHSIESEIHYVAKRSLFTNRLLARLLARLNAVPIRRSSFDRVAMDRLLELLEERRSILIFPEGSRVSGEQLAEARPGVGYLALKSGRPVVPIYVEGTNQLARGITRTPRLTIVHGKPIRLTDSDLAKWQRPEHFRDYGRMVMVAISALKDQYQEGQGLHGPSDRD
jgi:cytidylate kinase